MSEKHIVDGFTHRVGFHCESSSMRDLFEFYVSSMSEAMVFGLDGTLTCKLLGIQLRKQSFSSADKGWEESKNVIQQHKPLMLQVDLGHLDYIQEEGISEKLMEIFRIEKKLFENLLSIKM